MACSPLIRSVVSGLLLGVLLSSCGSESPIKVGFAGELTGKQSDLGGRGRDGVQLAVETVNARGGIAGRQIELLVRDDLGTPEGARATEDELIKADVVAIIGHMNSTQTVAGWPVAEAAGMILLSPVATSPELSGFADHFFRVVPTHISQAQIFGQHVYQNRGLSRLAIIHDTNNAAYSESYWQAFAEIYQRHGGVVTLELPFSSTAQPDFAALVAQLKESDAQGLLIVTSALDAALIAQQTRLQSWHVPLFSSAWAQTETLLQNGGQAVDGMEFTIAFDVNSANPAFLEFKQRYTQRFGHTPTFADGEAYEAALVLFAALEKTTGQTAGLAEALQQTRDFPGLVSPISLDQYGDAVRPLFLVTIKDGAFKTLPTVLKPAAN
jgi:branched-chain amino acid transport system substrate-binding protein